MSIKNILAVIMKGKNKSNSLSTLADTNKARGRIRSFKDINNRVPA